VVDRNQTEGTSCFTNTKLAATGQALVLQAGRVGPGQKIVLEANSRYHLGAPRGERQYNLAGGSAVTMYENDEIDVTASDSTISSGCATQQPLNAGFRPPADGHLVYRSA
jgi:hypothetical protein